MIEIGRKRRNRAIEALRIRQVQGCCFEPFRLRPKPGAGRLHSPIGVQAVDEGAMVGMSAEALREGP